MCVVVVAIDVYKARVVTGSFVDGSRALWPIHSRRAGEVGDGCPPVEGLGIGDGQELPYVTRNLLIISIYQEMGLDDCDSAK